MAESSNRSPRTLSDIRPPGQAPTAPAAKKPEPKKEVVPPAPELTVEPPKIEEPAKVTRQPKAKSRRGWLKAVITVLVIVALIAAVAAAYFYIFSEA